MKNNEQPIKHIQTQWENTEYVQKIYENQWKMMKHI